jgi:Transposase, Mutator family
VTAPSGIDPARFLHDQLDADHLHQHADVRLGGAEAALTSVVATCYLLGVSTRRMEKLVESLGITRLSKSQVGEMARDLDGQVEAFRTRPLDAGPYTFVAAGALVLKVREGGRLVNVHALLAAGVNADGHREIPGLQVTSAEDGAGWLGVLPGPDRPRPDRSPARHLRRRSSTSPSVPPAKRRHAGWTGRAHRGRGRAGQVMGRSTVTT